MLSHHDLNFSDHIVSFGQSGKLPQSLQIWQVTTIITTHYVDEARGAAKVGFMRGGKLIAEDRDNG